VMHKLLLSYMYILRVYFVKIVATCFLFIMLLLLLLLLLLLFGFACCIFSFSSFFFLPSSSVKIFSSNTSSFLPDALKTIMALFRLFSISSTTALCQVFELDLTLHLSPGLRRYKEEGEEEFRLDELLSFMGMPL